MRRAAPTRSTSESAARQLSDGRFPDNWVRHLLAIAQDFEQSVIARLESECGYDEMRPSLGPFLLHVWDAPRPLSQLARALRVSRQACGKLAQLAEQSGYAERVDGDQGLRAQQIRLTRLGQEVVDDGIRMTSEAEASYAERIGDVQLRRFITAISALYSGLDLEKQTDPTRRDHARRSIGVLPLIAYRVEKVLCEATRARGHDDLQLSHLRLVALVGHEGSRVSEMARHQGVSRQATSVAVQSLESLGYARRESDPHDGRAVRVVLTDAGETLLRDSIDALAEIEQDFREILGARRLGDLVRVAASLHAALRDDAETVEAATHGIPATKVRVRGPLSDEELRGVASRLERHLGQDDMTRLVAMLCDEPAARRG